jgi:Tfp pilus assembly protein PilF
MRAFSRLFVCAVGLCLLATSACRSPRWQVPEDVAVAQQQRRQVVQKSVGMKQSEAELHVARDAWRFGDRRACMAALEGILKREPGHVEALLLKAEVHLDAGELIEADRSTAIALSHAPSNETAKRLSEITRTRQLAERPREPVHPAAEVAAAPLPPGAVSQATYTPGEAGTALVEDSFPRATPAEPSIAPPAGEEQAIGTPEAELPAEPGFAVVEQVLSRVSEGPQWTAEQPASAFPLVAHAGLQPIDPEWPLVGDGLRTPPWNDRSLVEPSDIETSSAAPTALESAEAETLAANDKVAAGIGPWPESSSVPVQSAEEPPSDDSDAGMAEASDLSPQSDDSHPDPLGLEAAIAAGDSISALAAVEAGLIDNPNDPQIPISAAVTALEKDQPAMAASIARLGIAFHPASAGLHRALGAALYRKGSYPSSQVALQQSLSLDNSSALSYFLMGCVSDKLGDAEAAQAHFAHAAELDPTVVDHE